MSLDLPDKMCYTEKNASIGDGPMKIGGCWREMRQENFNHLLDLKDIRVTGGTWHGPAYVFRGIQVLSEDPARPEPDQFHGFVFQDTDLYKWIEASAYSLLQHPDPQLERSVRQKWFGCACCPPNIARLAGSVAAYACTENRGTAASGRTPARLFFSRSHHLRYGGSGKRSAIH